MPNEKSSVNIHACAKINLFLDIEGRREDGYHLLSMVNARISLHDVATCALVEKPRITLTCSDPSLPTDERNTAYQAAFRFREQARLQQGVSIHIDKKIPVGAGLAGGSSDAAAVLLALNQLADHPLSTDALREIAAGLGADVPFFFEEGICFCSGIGERIAPLQISKSPSDAPVYGVLCSPDESVSTQTAYRLWDEYENPAHSSPQNLIDAITRKKWDEVPACMFNTFESVVFAHYPVVEEAYRKFAAASPTPPRMSGSGSNLFSIHAGESEANAVVDKLRNQGLTASVFHLLY
ncbi:MAG: 4-(cytidine 5'-diphospho)-2-C-methyl-D-erythritol kinase [Candidatus Omnitrophica bacterium]|nr:4-(cytidine 5'-diphospho)-2-C-methyl-D-erythritol kinase [Candidatus Omnitrophota bacterium]